MRILVATGHPHIPQIAGGVQSNTHELIQALTTRGHRLAMLCGLGANGFLALRNRLLMKAFRRNVVADHGLGYPVFRAWFAWKVLAEVCAEFKPDVVFCQAGFPVRMAAECNRLGIPAAIYLHNVEAADTGGDPIKLRGIRYIANSAFTAERFRQRYGVISTVVPPFFDRERYATPITRERVVFINPHPHKGAYIALAIAEACPDIPFSFVEAWTLGEVWRGELNERLERLPNVELLPRSSNMKSIYAQARILLVPSKWEEAWGRVVTEAHFSGIPVIASRCGGLPEAVGPGGVLIDRDAPVSEWIAVVNRLWSDEEYWNSLSQAALTYSERDALNRERQIDTIISVLTAAANDGVLRRLELAV